MNGRIVRLIADKGYGFIQDNDGVERFFHRTGVVGQIQTLFEGQAVTFDMEESPKGPRATNVKPVES